jgi:hypothetical protein
MESWRKVWRDGLAPHFSSAALGALQRGLQTDDGRLIQGATTQPPPLECVREWSVEAACALGYCGWQGEKLDTVAQVEEFFARACFEADQRLGEPAACRWFLNWFDDMPREEVRRALLPEVTRSLAQRLRANDDEFDTDETANDGTAAA